VHAPAWSRPCWRLDRKFGDRYVLPCGRVDGRVLYVAPHDPDGDGDRHVLVLAGPHVVLVKLAVGARVRLPSVGSSFEAVGLLESDRGLPKLRVINPATCGRCAGAVPRAARRG